MWCLHRVPGEAMMSLMPGILGMHGHARGQGPLGTWWIRTPLAPEGESGATGHMVIPEPYWVVVLVPRSSGDA
jgi:hypothetical protein